MQESRWVSCPQLFAACCPSLNTRKLSPFTCGVISKPGGRVTRPNPGETWTPRPSATSPAAGTGRQRLVRRILPGPLAQPPPRSLLGNVGEGDPPARRRRAGSGGGTRGAARAEATSRGHPQRGRAGERLAPWPPDPVPAPAPPAWATRRRDPLAAQNSADKAATAEPSGMRTSGFRRMRSRLKMAAAGRQWSVLMSSCVLVIICHFCSSLTVAPRPWSAESVEAASVHRREDAGWG
ncbi:decreased expression in renal and prostate cancer protein-like [Choloepus didactylus]|uniref:decreased expression in renal and prostate cancer protein-like n=1 Tax=Choloepus didactylus TaxID=27675 RepID=UPI00189E7479|nr:decreased expression in renal and prostate cancer protein-like [Choloepus didactylus]